MAIPPGGSIVNVKCAHEQIVSFSFPACIVWGRGSANEAGGVELEEAKRA
jgi:hypothetical protein